MISESIKFFRKKAGISQQELGQRLGISQQQIAQYESGKRIPKIDTIIKIATALDISMTDILGEISSEQAKDIQELKNINTHHDATIGLLSILEYTYGRVEDDLDNECYIIGLGEPKFILSYEDVDFILKCIHSLIPVLVDRLKEYTAPED